MAVKGAVLALVRLSLVLSRDALRSQARKARQTHNTEAMGTVRGLGMKKGRNAKSAVGPKKQVASETTKDVANGTTGRISVISALTPSSLAAGQGIFDIST